MNFYPRHLGDYARDAGYLSMTEHGAYTLLLDWYYANERPIPKELVFSVCKASNRAEKQAAEKVLRAFFKWDASAGWRHKRVDAELLKMQDKRDKARQSAAARWDANAMRTHSEGNASTSNANAMLSNNQYPKGVAATPIRRGKGLQLIGEILKKENGDGR